MLVPLPNRKQEFMPTENPPINWYALRVTYCREMIVKRRLDACGIESFVPMRYKETVCGQRRRRTLVAAVHNLLFVHTTAEQLRTITDRTTGSTLIVPDKQMRDFIAVAGNPDEQHIYLDPDSTELRRGDRVRITGGLLAGVEGEFMRIRGDRLVLVSIAVVMAVATAFIHPSLIEALEPQRKTPAEKPAPHRTAPELRDGDRTPEPATRDRIS